MWTSGSSIFISEIVHEPTKVLAESSTIESLAYENLGDQMYYSVQGRPEIIQAALQGSTNYTIDTETATRNLMVDSSLAKLCWISFLNELKCSNLDGSNQTVIYSVRIDGDQRLYSAALDPKNHEIYLILYNMVTISRYEFLTVNINTKKLGLPRQLTFSHLEPYIYYLSGKLFFLENHQLMVTYDLAGHSEATSTLASRALSFTISADQKLLFPDSFPDFEEVQVIPNQIEPDSINITGTALSYRLNWNPGNMTNFGDLKYEVIILSRTFVVNRASLSLSEFRLHPYQEVNVTITAITAWARSPPTEASLHTPEARHDI